MSQPFDSEDLMHTVNGMLSDLCATLETDKVTLLHYGTVDVNGRPVKCEIAANLESGAIAIRPTERVSKRVAGQIKEPARQKEIAIVLLETAIQLFNDTADPQTQLLDGKVFIVGGFIHYG